MCITYTVVYCGPWGVSVHCTVYVCKIVLFREFYTSQGFTAHYTLLSSVVEHTPIYENSVNRMHTQNGSSYILNVVVEYSRFE